jgi:tetratricopeptide (TPR) repeat protein
MTKRKNLLFQLFSLLALVILIATAFGQNPPQNPPQNPAQKGAQTPAPMPPDRRAYSEASAIRDADKKIEALDKFIKEFPDSSLVYSAHMGIVDALVRNHPQETARILEQAGKAIEKSPNAQAKINAFSTLASQFCDANILINEAEGFANQGMQLIQEESAKAAANPPAQPAAKAQGDAPARPAQNPMANVNRLKTNVQLALGRIYLKQGKLDAAEKNLKDVLAVSPQPTAAPPGREVAPISANAVNPQQIAASLGLAEVYDRRGDTENALKTYINAAALGKLMPPQRQALNTLYAKTHKGSLAGLEEMLDAKYLEANPAPFAVEPYKPTAERTDRVVLAEVFTGSGCPPCVAADLAADIAMERYNPKELVVVMYHQHIPQPDPMTTPQTSARFKYYAGTGVPTMVIDGATSPGGGGSRDATKRVYDRITAEIDKKLNVPAEAKLKLGASLKGSIVKTSVTADQVTKESPDLKLHILLVEEKLRYTGENGVRFHPMVVRSMAGAEGTGLNLTSKGPLTWDFDLAAISAGIKKHLDEYEAGGHRGNMFTFAEKKYEINPKDLLVVAFVQDEKTKAILQTTMLKVK